METFTRYLIRLFVFSLSIQAAYSQSENILWLEDFSGLGDGTIVDNGPTAWSSNYNGRGHLNVQNNRLEAYYMDGIGEWTSEVIDISSVNYAEITMDISWFGGGGFSNPDIMRVYYILDGGPEVLFYENILTDFISSGGSETLSKVLKGNSVQIIIRSYNDFGCLWGTCSYNRFDNIEVKEVTTFYSRRDGNWNNGNTWSVVGFSGPSAGAYPTQREGAMVAHDVNVSGSAQAAFLEARSGGVVNLNANTLSMVRGGGIVVDDGGMIIGSPNSTLRIDDALTTDIVVNGDNGISVGRLIYNNGSGLYLSGSGDIEVSRDFDINVDNGSIDIDIPMTIGRNLEVNGANNLFAISVDQSWTDTDLDQNTTMLFDGPGDQTLSTNPGAILRNLTIDKSGGKLILNNTVNVAGRLNFTNGVIESSQANLLIFNDNATVVGASTSSYVEGPVRKIGNDNFTFPIGKDGFYAPVEMSGRQGFETNTQFTAEYFTEAGPNTQNLTGSFSHVSGMEYWDLERTYDQGNNARCFVHLYFMDEDRSQIIDPSDLVVAHYDGSAWESMGSGNYTGNSVRSQNRVTDFSPFTFGSQNGANPLPVELIAFAGANTEDGNLLSWKTASETNNDYFVIEKSANGSDWAFCGKVSGSGTVAHPSSYQFLDANAAYGMTYYRLKQVDFNGDQEYFPAISVNNDQELQFALEAIYPNPTTGKAAARFTASESGEVAVSVTNMQGQTVLMEKRPSALGHNSMELDLTGLNQGIYLISLQLGDRHVVQKIIKN